MTRRFRPGQAPVGWTGLIHHFGAIKQHLRAGGVPVIVEGPMDAIAVTLASGGRYIGVAPLGTSLTDEQVGRLARVGNNPIVATDADIAGRVAAERDFWLLTPNRLDPRYARLPEGCDPADMLALRGPDALTAVPEARSLGEQLITERLTNLPPDQARLEATRVLAARPPVFGNEGTSIVSSRPNVPLPAVRENPARPGQGLEHRPATGRHQPAAGHKRCQNADGGRPDPTTGAVDGLAGQLDQRLLGQGDWPALAQLMQTVHDQGHDVAAITRGLVTATPLNDLPAQDLRYRLVAHLGLSGGLRRHPIDTSTSKITARSGSHRRALASSATVRQAPSR